MTENQVLDHALELAKDGFKVFPLKPGDKKPAISRWPATATNDLEKIRAWWTKDPHNNIGLSTQGLLVVDLDVIEGRPNPWPNDPAQRKELESAPSQTTAHGGTHYFFRQPEGMDLRISQSKLAPKVDTRANGGYVVAAPSKLSNGGVYAWNNQTSLKPMVSLPLVPTWLLDLLDKLAKARESKRAPVMAADRPRPAPTVAPSGKLKRAKAYLSNVEPSISGQRGHDTAFRAATYCFEKFDLSEAEAWDALQEWNGRCQPPWSDKELKHKIEDTNRLYTGQRGTMLDTAGDAIPAGMNAMINEMLANHPPAQSPTKSPAPERMASVSHHLPPGRIQPVQSNGEGEQQGRPAAAAGTDPFPVEFLPSTVQAFVTEVSSCLGCDPAFVAVPALACLAGAIGGTRAIRLKRGWDELPILWTAVVARSGSMKTPASSEVISPFVDIQKNKNNEYIEKYTDYEKEIKKFESSNKKEFKNETFNYPRIAPEPPKQEKVLFADCTIQKLAEILNDNPRGSLCAPDELSGWFSGLNRYATPGSSDLAQWLSLHSGTMLQVDRKMGRPIFVAKAMVSLTGGIQPGILKQNLKKEIVQSGAIARFLLAMPPVRAKRWQENEISQATTHEWGEIIRRLLSLQLDDGEGKARPRIIHLSPQSKSIWIDFFNQHAEAQKHAKEESQASFLSKMEAQAARLALVLCMADRAASNRHEDLSLLEPVWINAGIVLARWFIRERERIEVALNQSEEAPQGLADRVQLILQQAGSAGLSKSEISGKLGRNLPASHVEAALIELQNRGLALVQKVETSGKSKSVWRVIEGG